MKRGRLGRNLSVGPGCGGHHLRVGWSRRSLVVVTRLCSLLWHTRNPTQSRAVIMGYVDLIYEEESDVECVPWSEVASGCDLSESVDFGRVVETCGCDCLPGGFVGAGFESVVGG